MGFMSRCNKTLMRMKQSALTRLEFLYFEFYLKIRFPNSIELNRRTTFDFVRFGSEIELIKKVLCPISFDHQINKIKFYRSINFFRELIMRMEIMDTNVVKVTHLATTFSLLFSMMDIKRALPITGHSNLNKERERG